MVVVPSPINGPVGPENEDMSNSVEEYGKLVEDAAKWRTNKHLFEYMLNALEGMSPLLLRKIEIEFAAKDAKNES